MPDRALDKSVLKKFKFISRLDFGEVYYSVMTLVYHDVGINTNIIIIFIFIQNLTPPVFSLGWVTQCKTQFAET